MDMQTDWHDWLKEAERWYKEAKNPASSVPQEACLEASWRCLLRWASRIEFFNE